MSEQIQKYLSEHSDHGRTISEGQFTISGRRAVQKLAEFAVARSEQWVLKWVQGAVASRATRIEFVQTRRGTQARAWLPRHLSIASLEGCLLRLEEPGHPFWREAVVGLRALLTRGKLSISCSDGNWSWDGESASLEAERVELRGASVAVCFELGEFDRVAWQMGECRELAERCFCRVPTSLDRRPLNSVASRPASSHKPSVHGTFSPRLLAAGVVPWSRREEGEAQLAQVSGTDALRSGQPFLCWPDKGWQGRTLSFRLMASHSGQSTLARDFVSGKVGQRVSLLNEPFRVGASRFGVLCGSLQSRQITLGGELVVEAHALRTDLSGLTVEQNEDWWQLLHQALVRFKGVLNRLQAELNRYEPDSLKADLKTGAGNLLAGLAGGALLGFLKGGPLGLVITGPAGAYAGFRYGKDDEATVVREIQAALRNCQNVLERTSNQSLQNSKQWRVESVR